MEAKILVILMAAVLVAGCTGQALPWDGSGGDFISSSDLIVATNQPTIPSSPASGTDFTARFTVKNQDNDRKAENVGVWIYDTGKCAVTEIADKPAIKAGGMWPGLAINTEGGTIYKTDFVAGQEELVKIDLKAPESSDIGSLPYTCPIRYFVNYSFTAKSSMTADVMSADRLKQLEAQTGERPVYTRTLNVGAGPIQIFMDTVSTMPVETGKTLKFEITAKNQGKGSYASIKPSELELKVPEAFGQIKDSNNYVCSGYFIYEKTENGVSIYHNQREIALIQNEANPITCEFTMPSSVPVEQVYTINTELAYIYSYYGDEIAVAITP